MKIRIGNDISVNIHLSYKFDEFYASVISAVVYFVNSSKENEIKANFDKKTRFVHRFPIEPCSEAYSSTAYDIKSSGLPWHIFPHYKPVYQGFGLHPDWKNIYGHCDNHDFTRYRSEIKYTGDRSVVKAFFPAEKLLFTGTYDIIVVAKVYEPGYYNNDVRTVTIDKKDAFTLVSSTEDGVDGEITISVNADSANPQPSSGSSTVSKIDVTGPVELVQGSTADLVVDVLPNSASDKTVSYQTSLEDAQYITINKISDSNFEVAAKLLPDDEDSHTVAIKFISNQNSEIFAEHSIKIVKSPTPVNDVYVNRGAYIGNPSNGGNIRLTLTNELQVPIDLSKVTGWYEGD